MRTLTHRTGDPFQVLQETQLATEELYRFGIGYIGSLTYTTLKSPQPHPTAGEYCSPLLGGERLRLIQHPCTERLQYPKQVQYDQYDGDNNQGVNPTTRAREA